MLVGERWYLLLFIRSRYKSFFFPIMWESYFVITHIVFHLSEVILKQYRIGKKLNEIFHNESEKKRLILFKVLTFI